MKKWPVLMLMLMVLTSGCVSMKIQRGVQGNYFYSTLPEIALEMDPKLEYINKVDSSEWNMFRDTDRGSRQNNERYVFIDRLTQTAVIVSITVTNEGYWTPPDMSKMKNVISSGYENHVGSSYNYSVRVVNDDKGECLLVKEYIRLSGGLGDTLINVIYLESTKDNSQDPDNWRQAAMHDPAKQKRLQEFLENTEMKLQFIDIKTLNLAKK